MLLNQLRVIKRRYETLPLHVKAGVWFTVTGFIQKAIAFLTMPVFTRLMPADEYGVIALFNSWESFFLLFITLNVFWGSFNAAMMDYDKERDQYTSSLVGFMTTSCLTWFIVYFLIHSLIDKFTGLSFFQQCLMFCQILFQGYFCVWISRLKFEYDYKKVLIGTALLFLISPVISIIGIISFPSNRVDAKLLGQVIGYIIVGCYAFNQLYIRGRILYDKNYWLYAISFSLPLTFHYLASSVLAQADRIMIAQIVGKSFAGIYVVAYSLSMAFNVVTTSANQAIIPWFYNKIKDNKIELTYSPLYGFMLFVVFLILLIMLIGPEALTIIAPCEYHEAVVIIPPIMACSFFLFIYLIFADIEFYFKKKSGIVVASAFAALVNIIFNLLLIPVMGIVGAAYTTLVCYVILGFFHYLNARKVTRSHGLIWSFKVGPLLIMSLFLLIMQHLVSLTYPFTMIRYSIIILILIVLYLSRRRVFQIFETR